MGSSAGAAVKRMRRGRGQEAQDPDSLLGPLSAALDEREREMLERTTAVMSLLEGHANWVMDGVDSSIVSSVKTIRRRFERRADLRGPLDRAVRRLLGLEAKAAQYVQGQRFVTEVVEAVGRDGFNRVWLGSQNLPSAREIRHPQEWVDRVAF